MKKKERMTSAKEVESLSEGLAVKRSFCYQQNDEPRASSDAHPVVHYSTK
jgi:hypothetical protein